MSKIRIRRCDFIIFAHICRRIKPNIGAIVYARYAYRNGALSRRLISAKSKIAPLKAISIPYGTDECNSWTEIIQIDLYGTRNRNLLHHLLVRQYEPASMNPKAKSKFQTIRGQSSGRNSRRYKSQSMATCFFSRQPRRLPFKRIERFPSSSFRKMVEWP